MPPSAEDQLVSLLARRRAVVLTGAGCSTESGIPDYRGPKTRAKARNPLQYREFIESAAARRRYWARAALGWRRIASARPNPAHRALAELQERGVISTLITQNVDRLHHAAGSREVIELHGALAEVRCLGCNDISARADLQARMFAANPGWESQDAAAAPDGDADLELALMSRFTVPPCAACGGVLKPNVVFFGESVPPDKVQAGYRAVRGADVLLIVGSSLAVFSGYRFARAAAAEEIPIAIVNLGESRADSLAAVRLDGEAGAVLASVAARLRGASR